MFFVTSEPNVARRFSQFCVSIFSSIFLSISTLLWAISVILFLSATYIRGCLVRFSLLLGLSILIVQPRYFLLSVMFCSLLRGKYQQLPILESNQNLAVNNRLLF